MVTVFGNRTPEEFSAVERERDAALAVVADLRSTLDGLQIEQRREESTDRMYLMVKETLKKAEEAGGVIDQVVEAELAAKVVDVLVAEKVATLVKNRRQEVERDTKAEINTPEWVANTRDEYDKMFEEDGTYAAIRAEVERDVRSAIREQQLEKAKKAIDADLEKRPLSVDDEEILESIQPELDEYRAQGQAERAARVREEALRLERAKIDEELDEEHDKDVDERRREWAKSYEGQQYRRIKEQEAVDRRKKQAEKGGKALIDDELRTAEEIYETYLREFTHDGVDLATIPAGVSLVIAMGETKLKDNPRYNFHGPDKRQKIERLDGPNRILRLSSRGDGHFYVSGDSLEESINPYLRALSIRGKVISLGRHVEDKSKSRSGIEQKLAKGDIPFFDEDTTSPDIVIDGQLPLLNVKLAGVSAIPKYAELDR